MASWAASSAFSLCVVTASVEPPQLDEALAPSSHCGSGAARHLPLDFPAISSRNTGPHAAVDQVTPVLRDFLDRRVVHVDGDLRPIDLEGTRPCLPNEASDPATVRRREVCQVGLRVGFVELLCLLCELVPGSRNFQPVLIKYVLAVQEGHGTAVPRHRVDRISF